MGWVAKDPIGKIEKKIVEILILSVWKYVEKPQNAPIRPTLPYQISYLQICTNTYRVRWGESGRGANRGVLAT